MSREVKRCVQNLGCLVIGVLLLAMPAAAQIGIGDNVKLGMSGDLTSGYSSSFGTSGSSHGLDLGGSGSLHGSYYSPQFISFDAQPFYNRSQANSAYQSITDSSGVNGSVNIFSGSHYPGSVTFGRTYDSNGQFGMPGVTGLSTKASGKTLGINWAAAFPSVPNLNLDVGYLLSGQDSSLYGASSNTHLGSRTLNFHSNYSIAGFLFTGFINHQSLDMKYPSFMESSGVEQPSSNGNGGNSSYGVIATHRIPLKGYWSGSVNHNSYGSDTQSNGIVGSSRGSSNSISNTVSVQLAPRLGVSMGANYQTNLMGALQQQLLEAGGFTPLRSSDTSSKAFNVRADTYYQLTSHLNLNGQWNHQQEYINGKSIGVTQYGGGVSSSYVHHLLGSLTFNVGAMDTATQAGNSGASMYGSINFSRRVLGWETGADFDYAQQVQTLGGVYTTSMYGYGGAIRRKFGDRFYWSNSARETHSGLAQQAGTSSHSNSFSTTVLYRKYSANAVYSQSGGTSILTSQGLVAIPGGIPAPLVQTPILYDGRSFGGGVTATITRFSLTGSYSRALSATTAKTFSNNSTTMYNALIRCRMRKLYFNAGFTRFQQSVGAAGVLPSVLNSYYFGFSRWFNVF